MSLRERYGKQGGAVANLLDESGARLFNTEAQGPVHQALRNARSYVCSEYLGEEHLSGAVIDGVMHQDLMQLSFADEEFDYVLTSDVLEHVPRPYDAHREIFRVLRVGGTHIFTVPFLSDQYDDDVRTVQDPDGGLTHLKEPELHGDPIRAEGALVFTIFSLEMLIRLGSIGFRTSMHTINRARNGIYPPGAIVFEAKKTA